MTTILVTGATGQLGQGVVTHLSRRAKNTTVAALARSKDKAIGLFPEHVEVRLGDYTDPASLAKAFSGVDTLVFISANAFTDVVSLHKNVIKAAADAGVKHILYTAIQRAPGSTFEISQVTEWDNATIEGLEKSGVPHTILRNTLYMDALPWMLGNDFEDGLLAPAGHTKAALASRDDLADATAILALDGTSAGRSYTLGGSTTVSLDDIAAIIGKSTSRDVRYIDTPVSTFVAERVKAGTPDFLAAFMAEWFQALAAGDFSEVTGDLETILGRKPVTPETFIPLLFDVND
jgi:NAD(P)H dehydrogenase (quinone)